MASSSSSNLFDVSTVTVLQQRRISVLSPSKNEEPVVQKSKWGSKFEFFLAVLGYSIGMGSLTRFPYLCMKNGGGAFLIPWIFALLVGGIPLFYMELVLGQFSGKSPLTMWSLCPALKGIGYACALLSGLSSIFYNMQIGYCIIYLVMSFGKDIPWRGCDHSWSSENCYDPFANSHCAKFTSENSTYYLNSTTNFTLPSNTTACVQPKDFVLPSEDFWNNIVLGTNGKGMHDIGGLRWQLVLCLFSAWVMVFLCLMKGVQSLGKVVYVTATAPYLLLTALVIRGVTLEGAAEGLIFYLKPNFTSLTDPRIWVEASLTMFYSLGPAWGGIITMASHNPFNHRLAREATVIPIADVFTALYGGVAVFSVAGFMAQRSKMPINRFAKSGAALSFVVIPQAIAELPISPMWSIMFFLTMITMAIDSQFGMVDTVITGILDLYPKFRNHKVKVTAAVCLTLFFLGLPCATEGGMYILVLMDWYVAAIALTTVAFLELVIVSYVYGLTRFSEDIKLMLGSPPNWYFKFSWLIITPLFMFALLFIGMWNLHPPTYQGYHYPNWAVALGWIASMISFAPIPGFAIYAFFTSPHKSISTRFTSLFLPSNDWVPSREDLVDSYLDKYSKTKKNKTPCHTNNRCAFCQETNETVKCHSMLKCWVCFCACRILGNKMPEQTTDDQVAATTAAKVNYSYDDDFIGSYPSSPLPSVLNSVKHRQVPPAPSPATVDHVSEINIEISNFDADTAV